MFYYKITYDFFFKYYTRMLKYTQIIYFLDRKSLPIIPDLKYQTRILKFDEKSCFF